MGRELSSIYSGSERVHPIRNNVKNAVGNNTEDEFKKSVVETIKVHLELERIAKET